MEEQIENNCYWFAFYEGQVLIEKRAGGWHIPVGAEPPAAIPEGSTVHEIGDGRVCGKGIRFGGAHRRG